MNNPPSTESVDVMGLAVPDLNDAIIIEAKDDISIEEYLNAIGQLINPKEIKSASKESNFICIFLSNPQWVNSLILERETIDIKGRTLKIQSLQTTLLVLYNVFPTIPDDVIKQTIGKYTIEINRYKSEKLQPAKPDYSHVLTFNKYITVKGHVCTLPPQLRVNHEGITYIIKIDIYKVCSRCYMRDHVTTQCHFFESKLKENLKVMPHSNVENNKTNTSQVLALPSTEPSTSANDRPLINKDIKKRSLRDTTHCQIISDLEEENEVDRKKHKTNNHAQPHSSFSNSQSTGVTVPFDRNKIVDKRFLLAIKQCLQPVPSRTRSHAPTLFCLEQ